MPDGEREEVRQLFEQKGLRGEALDSATEAITSDRERWVDMMLKEEYGLSSTPRSPSKAAASTFASFLLCGAVPLLPFALGLPSAFMVSTVATGLVFAAIGAFKSRWALAPAWWSALETVLIGAAAAAVAYIVGDLLKSIG